MILLIVGIIIIMLGLYFIGTYNSFQVTQTRINASIQEIANQLKRQANLIPNLVESAKGYLKHEKSIFDELSNARKTILSAVKDQSKLSTATEAVNKLIPQLIAVMESNPQLKSDAIITKLMDELRDTAEKLMYSRRSLIDLTADYNAKLLVFPSNIITGIFGFKRQLGYQPSESNLKNSDVKL